MYKYLLTALLTTVSISASGYTYRYVDNTMRYSITHAYDRTNDVTDRPVGPGKPYVSTQSAATYGADRYTLFYQTETITTINTEKFTGGLISMDLQGIALLSTNIGNPYPTSFTRVGLYELHDKAYNNDYVCVLPLSLESDTYMPTDVNLYSYIFVRFYKQAVMATETFMCGGTYAIEKDVAITLDNPILHIAGSRHSELTGTTKLTTTGTGGMVRINIANMNDKELTVSFNPDRTDTTISLNLNMQQQYVNNIYVSANPKNPGDYVYPVQLNAVFE